MLTVPPSLIRLAPTKVKRWPPGTLLRRWSGNWLDPDGEAVAYVCGLRRGQRRWRSLPPGFVLYRPAQGFVGSQPSVAR